MGGYEECAWERGIHDDTNDHWCATHQAWSDDHARMTAPSLGVGLAGVVSIRRSRGPCGNGGEHNPDCFDPNCPFDAPDPEATRPPTDDPDAEEGSDG